MASPYRMRARPRKARVLSAAERRALAPTPSRAAHIAYQKLIARLMERLQAAVLRHLLPSSVRQDALGDDFADSFARLQAEIDSITADVELPLAGVAREVVRHNLAESDKVLGGAPGGSEAFGRQVGDFVRQNVEKVRSIEASQLGRLREVVAQHAGPFGDQTQVAALRAKLMDTFRLPKARAQLLARDQVLKLNSQITKDRQERAGIDSYVWTTSRDERVRGRPGGVWANTDSDHWALDGKVFKWSDPPVVNPVTGARAHPGQDFQCRCIAVPLVEHVVNGPAGTEVVTPAAED